MRILFSIFSLFLLTACNRGQNQTPGKASADSTGSVEITQGDANQITCWGIGDIELSDDLATIEEKIGKEHLKQDSLFMEGMFETMVTTVWSSTPKEITIRWKEKEPPYQTIDYLEIASAEAPYHFANGVRIGMSLKELEQLNGAKPINLYGFGWDYGGTFVDFGEGKLKGDMPCFGGAFALDQTEANNDLKAILGDQVLSSNHPSFTKIAAKLQKIRIVNKD